MQAVRTSEGSMFFKLTPLFANKILELAKGHVTYKTFKNRGKVKVFVSDEDQKINTPLGDLFFFKGYYLELI